MGWVCSKEKLKLLKADLKCWNREIFGHLGTVIDEKKSEVEALDRIDDVFGLEPEEVIRRNRVTAEKKFYLVREVTLSESKENMAQRTRCELKILPWVGQ